MEILPQKPQPLSPFPFPFQVAQAAQTGKLFQTEGLEMGATLKPEVQSPVHIFTRFSEPLTDGLVHLGGERRMAALTQADVGWPRPPKGWLESIQTAGGLSLTVTPALFEAGYRPGWLDDDLTGHPPTSPKLKLRLRSTAVARWQAHSGWDLQRQKPKAMRKMIPAGVVDLPIARARATQLPIVPGSSLRGVIRAQIETKDAKAAKVLFGPRNVNAAEEAFAGALAVGDAHLLLLPVRSLGGIICYITCPFVLNRYRQDLRRAGVEAPEFAAVPDENVAHVVADTVNLVDDKLVLEDLDLRTEKKAALAAWANQIATTIHPEDTQAQQDLTQRFALLPDSIFSFLAETATEIRTRIAIDPKTGVVKRGALWYEGTRRSCPGRYATPQW